MAEFRQMHACEATFLSPFQKKKKKTFSVFQFPRPLGISTCFIVAKLEFSISHVD